MTEPRYFTSSELRLWQKCRRQWYIRHFLQYGPKRDPGDVSVARTGTLFAAGCEVYYNGGSVHDALSAVAGTARENECGLIESGAEHRVPALRKNVELVEIMLSGFTEWLEETGADSDLTIVSAEEEISVEHPEIPGAWLLGKTDQRAVRRSTGRRLILDNKTCSSASDQEILAPMSPQFKHYGVIELLRDPDKVPVEGAIVRWARRVKRTARAKPPFYGEIFVPLPLPTLRSYYRQSTGLIREILAAEERLRAGESEDYVCGPTVQGGGLGCGSCPFRAVCPTMDSDGHTDNSLTELLRWSYEKTDPLARYGEEDHTEEAE